MEGEEEKMIKMKKKSLLKFSSAARGDLLSPE